MSRKTKKYNASLEKRVENILHDRLGHMLADVDFRIQQAYSIAGRGAGHGGTVYAEDLNIPGRHFMTGYTVTNNSPSAGYVAWTDLHMVYQGVDTLLTNGNSNKKYLWWSPTVTPTVLQSSDTKPTLAAGEVLLFMNTAGIHKVMLSDTNSSMPSLVADSTIDSDAINGRAIGQAQLGLLAVDSTILAGNAVTVGKINAGAINSATLFANTPVTSAVLATGAVIAGKIGAGGISASNQFAANVVDTNSIKPGNVTATEIANGGVTPSKLNILRHVLY